MESKMSAVAEVPLNPLPTPASPNWLQRLSALDRAQRMRLGAGVALLVAAAVAAVVMGVLVRPGVTVVPFRSTHEAWHSICAAWLVMTRIRSEVLARIIITGLPR